jgi:hypothetical protein
MPRWMINCREYAALASNCMDRKLSTLERISMKLHQWLCPPCHEVIDQFDTIRQACRSMLDENREQSENSDKLSEEARQRLKETLNQLAK